MSTATVANETVKKPRMLSLRVTDVTGQKQVRVRVPADDNETTVGEMVPNLTQRMKLAATAKGRPLTYAARLEREGRLLNGSELVSSLREDDLLMLSPSIMAG